MRSRFKTKAGSPVVVDPSPDAQRLPIPDRSFDTAVLVSVLHHVADPAAAICEARRILRSGGRLAMMVYTLEDIEDLWLLDYFPSTQAWMEETTRR